MQQNMRERERERERERRERRERGCWSGFNGAFICGFWALSLGWQIEKAPRNGIRNTGTLV